MHTFDRSEGWCLFTCSSRCSEPDTRQSKVPVGVILSGAVGGALAVAAVMTAVLRATGRIKTVKRDWTPNVEMRRLKSNQEGRSLDEPFLPHGQARATESCLGGDAVVCSPRRASLASFFPGGRVSHHGGGTV